MSRTVCVIDDEFLSRQRVAKLLGEKPEFVIAGEADNGREAIELINRVKPDLVFLDIKMPGYSGFQVLQEAVHKPAVIFITAYNEHAVRAFDIHAIDYLLKPFQDSRFYEALDRVPLGTPPDGDTLQQLRALVEESIPRRKYLDRLTVKDRFEYLIIPVEEIDFFQAEEGLVFLYKGEFRYLVEQTLSQLEESLSPEIFFRAHRKSLINLRNVERMIPWGRGRYVLKFSSGEKVHLSKEKTQKIKYLLGMK